MRCDDLRERLDSLWEGEQSPEVRQHLAQCAACERYVRDLRLVRAGFRVLKREAVPEPSLGFAERLVRRWGELSKQPSVGEFFEQVGRRFVYATLMLTFLLLLALALPPTGPIRGQSTADPLVPAEETVLVPSDPLGVSNVQDVSDGTSVDVAAPPATKGAK
ncbi:MAG: hypothetical protein ABSA41_10690 [Terriglobia bacterium]